MSRYYDLRISVDAHALTLANATDPKIVHASADPATIRLDPEAWRRLCGAVIEGIALRMNGGE